MVNCELEQFRRTSNEYIVNIEGIVECKVKMIQDFFKLYKGCNTTSLGIGTSSDALCIKATKNDKSDFLWITGTTTKEDIAEIHKVLKHEFDETYKNREVKK